MKKVSFILAIVAVSLVSCNKEGIQSNKDIEEDVTLKAVIDPEFATLVKSDYAISGSTATFSWTSGDAFRKLVKQYVSGTELANVTGYYNHYTYTLASISGTSAEFTGSAVGSNWHDSGFALFPADLANGANLTEYSASGYNNLYLQLIETLIYDAANPLKNVVPMVGKLSGSTYTFKPIVGILAITLNNIPSAANKVTLYSATKGFSGYSVTLTSKQGTEYQGGINDLIGLDADGLKNSWFTAGTTKSYSFTAGTLTDATFYFPAPVGDFSDLQVLVKEGDTVLKTISSSTTITSTRGKITRLTAIDCNNF